MTVPANKCLLVFFLVSTVKIAESSRWKYEDESEWPSQCRKGKAQSPIDLSTSSAMETNFPPFVFTRWEQTYPAKATNNGHTIRVVPLVDDRPKVQGGGLVGTYLLDHFHFHWHSEHTIDDKRFAAEIHFVLYSDKFKIVDEALNRSDGMAVLAVMFYISPDDSDAFKLFPPIIAAVATNQTREEQLQITPKTLLPQDTAGFFRYPGSLTTPTCNEGIVWTLFTHYLPISESQWNTFLTVTDVYKKQMKRNYRSSQGLNGRTVFIRKSSSGAQIPYVSVLAFVTMMLHLKMFA